MARVPVVPAEAGTQSRQHHFGTICMIRLCSGLGPSLRWDDEYLRFREVPIYKLMIEKWNKIVFVDQGAALLASRLVCFYWNIYLLSLIHISEPTRLGMI